MDDKFQETVLKESHLPPDRIVFVHAKGFDISKIERGVVTVYAIWSGTSHMAWGHLTSVLSQHLSLDFVVQVLNADEMTEEFVSSQLPLLPHGNGESFWVRDGKIIFTWGGWKSQGIDLARFTQEAFGERK